MKFPMEKFMVSPTLDSRVFYACIITQYESSAKSWYVAYIHLPWKSTRLEEFIVNNDISYVGQGQQSWEYDSMVKSGTWLGLDWFDKPQPSTDEIRRILQTIINVIHENRIELGASS